ncbi:Crp/Fnr family transcriptional regulator [Legionella maioricensis]|uniref:Cyclic nucleotide-binding domain-containing protein n=1 Tax=Legionella maioricensis TaxID=2896528 RepID=A0A9X2ICD2_9GAMM|nr:cyclic nucleotide-binding domain-containing protein [Legionella maioricensis]MCL9683633.1 cyclic nucleotide-binding domain-containing protein [Legionella maioricensis]MCL9687655.1 cyclic nucleotide-binding domain-containing protein [Legionella maioricensis]
MDNKILSNNEAMEQTLNINNQIINTLGGYLDLAELGLLLKHSKISSSMRGEVLLHQGEKIDAVYLILKGQVLVAAKIMCQGITNLEILQPGSFLSPIGFIGSGPCPTSFKAQSPVLYLTIPNSYFELLAVDSPETKYKIFRVIAGQICSRLKILHDRVTSFISNSNMTSLSFFGKVIDSLNQPKKTDIEDTKELLERFILFKSFTKDEFETVCHHFIILDAPKNCKLINEGDKTPSCYLVIYGAIQSCILQDNKRAKLSIIGPGILLASMGCIESNLSFNVSYITCEQTILCKLSESSLSLIKETQPQLWYKLFNLFCGSLAALKKSVDKLDIRLNIENYNR